MVAAPSPEASRIARPWVAAALACIAAVAIAAGALQATLPTVGSAPARVAAILRLHGARPVAVGPRERVARAVVATEDERFYRHGAVDFISLGRVALHALVGWGPDPGGATIAQQLAKLLYGGRGGVWGDLRAVGLAFKLDHRFAKREILALYLNANYYGHGFYGVEQASRGYFGRPPDALSWAQASLLAGLPQAPTAYDPFRHPAAARVRRGEVVRQLVANRILTAAQARAVAAAPLGLRPAAGAASAT